MNIDDIIRNEVFSLCFKKSMNNVWRQVSEHCIYETRDNLMHKITGPITQGISESVADELWYKFDED